MKDIADCALCGAETSITGVTEEFRQENPLADHYQLTCTEGCSNNGWSARNAAHMIEEWNETQRVTLAEIASKFGVTAREPQENDAWVNPITGEAKTFHSGQWVDAVEGEIAHVLDERTNGLG